MRQNTDKISQPLDPNLIAPCGMNCATCLAYLREKNSCSGCLTAGTNKAKHCSSCIIKNCEKLSETESGYCYDCHEYPCKRLKNLDKRYRTNYQMSMLDNLDDMKRLGPAKFVIQEQARWLCKQCGEQLCVHRPQCQNCGESWSKVKR